MSRGEVADREHDGESPQARLEGLGDPLSVRPLLVGRVQDPLMRAVGQQSRAAMLAKGFDLGAQEGVELSRVRPAVPLHEHSRVRTVPPDRGNARDREVDVVAVALSHLLPRINVTKVTCSRASILK